MSRYYRHSLSSMTTPTGRGFKFLIKVKTALTAFQNLIDQGEGQQDGSYKIKRLLGQTDHDGYTVTLFDDSVQLNIFFHNKFDIKFENNKALDRFISQIEEIAKL